MSFVRSTHRRLRAASFYPLAGASALCIALLVARICVTHRLTFVFLVWNLFLAWVPYVFTPVVGRSRVSRGLAFATGTLWLLFLPNAPYLVTDLVHLHPRVDVPLWCDATILAAFAITGIALMTASLAQVHAAIERRTDRHVGWLFVVATLALSSFGIYLGRVLRWNSWDALVQPHRLARNAVGLALDPAMSVRAFAFTLVATAMLVAVYAAGRDRFAPR